MPAPPGTPPPGGAAASGRPQSSPFALPIARRFTIESLKVVPVLRSVARKIVTLVYYGLRDGTIRSKAISEAA
jgi:hypothetical protein